MVKRFAASACLVVCSFTRGTLILNRHWWSKQIRAQETEQRPQISVVSTFYLVSLRGYLSKQECDRPRAKRADSLLRSSLRNPYNHQVCQILVKRNGMQDVCVFTEEVVEISIIRVHSLHFQLNDVAPRRRATLQNAFANQAIDCCALLQRRTRA